MAVTEAEVLVVIEDKLNEKIVAIAAIQKIVALAIIQLVVASQAELRVVVRRSREIVVAAGAVDDHDWKGNPVGRFPMCACPPHEASISRKPC